MNKYESIIIVNPKLNEKQQNEIENKYKKIINKNGNVISIENIGKKILERKDWLMKLKRIKKEYILKSILRVRHRLLQS